MRLKINIVWAVLIGSLLLFNPIPKNADAFSFGKDKRRPRIIIVLVDMSGSTNKARRTVYRNAFELIYKSLNQKDRIVVGTITSHSYIDFKPALDETIPHQSIWDNRLQFEQNFTNTKKRIRTTVENLFKKRHGTQYTEILNSLNIADTIFHNEKRQKILVILSDMIQDSKEFKFDKANLNNKYITDVIKMRKQQNAIPNLADVKIYVAGASAPNTKKFRAIKKFWSQYFAVTGADFSKHRYGHSMIEFEKDDS